MAVPSHASVLPTFTGMALDRASAERKEGEWVRRKLEDPGARLLTATQEGVALTKVRWVDRGDVRRALAGDDSVFRLPPRGVDRAIPDRPVGSGPTALTRPDLQAAAHGPVGEKRLGSSLRGSA